MESIGALLYEFGRDMLKCMLDVNLTTIEATALLAVRAIVA